KYSEVLGVKSYPNLESIDRPVDLVVVALRAEAAVEAVEEAGRIGANAAVVVAGGFAEIGPQGAALQDRLVETARKYGLRVIGPNCIGVYNALTGLDTFFLPWERMRRPFKGPVGLVSQSGALLTMMMDLMAGEGVGVVMAANIGNKADVDEAEIIEYYSSLDEVRVIWVYVENLSNLHRLLDSIAEARKAGKRVVLLKGGRTSAGSRAASSHTAAVAGRYDAFKDLALEAGAVIVERIRDAVDTIKALALLPKPRGPRVAVATNAGGPGVVATDTLEEEGLSVPPPSEGLRRRLLSRFPPIASLSNPFDLTGMASDGDFERLLPEAARSGEYDMILAVVPVQPATMTAKISWIVAKTAWESKLPVAAATLGGGLGEEVLSSLASLGIPSYREPDRAARALAALYQSEAEPCIPDPPSQPPRAAIRIVEEAISSGYSKLREELALELARSYGLETARYCVAESPEEAGECFDELGGTVVAKVASTAIEHKTDVGGVVTGIRSSREAVEAYRRLSSIASRFGGSWTLLFQEEIGGVELIVGATTGRELRGVAVLGPGGIFVEAGRELAYTRAPASRCGVYNAVNRQQLLRRLSRGFRGMPPLSVEQLYKLANAISRMPLEISAVVDAEANPAFYTKDARLVVADFRVVLESSVQ
ncbi:MAG: acetate--CoA ligase family protein, partial [Aeropyrum sp.]|nr:acetate--CoA ligase family protein [Aeropyrum sp.]